MRWVGPRQNTICGRNPILLLLTMLEHEQADVVVKFVRYEQSSKCVGLRDSSVSYVSGLVCVKGGSA
jgi:predicted class III extradiol MEMO1 family dioxygenase